MAETLAISQIGPDDNGTPMSLDEFARIEGRPGYLYELDKGIIVVVDIPGLPHGLPLQVIRDALVLYRAAHAGRIYYIAGGSDAALRLPGMQSERHPDLSVYLAPPPVPGPQPWDRWVPDLVIEVISEGSEERDYIIKRDEHHRAGVRVYWIFNPNERSVLSLTRAADTWIEQRLDATASLTTQLLPRFALPLADVFAAPK